MPSSCDLALVSGSLARKCARLLVAPGYLCAGAEGTSWSLNIMETESMY